MLKWYFKKYLLSHKNTLHRHYKYRTVTPGEQETRCARIGVLSRYVQVYSLNDIVKICVYYYYYNIPVGPCNLYDLTTFQQQDVSGSPF